MQAGMNWWQQARTNPAIPPTLLLDKEKRDEEKALSPGLIVDNTGIIAHLLWGYR
jgi:hypothetical protein